ncbi:hypothetical protein P153DRAFT_429269 [Dothidotthia symphoricarpi CBS 119687]|uniref:Uncharacterized protein n=1 Tax=Dothidotthia symphoricarpi CBS 119687 TaxID=1392245 RepID=A0A6A6ALR8_9PLEO|nr:uncharacterized protein P153DRAFT_429269 [Dothidotthia symphoricarpi CBS 119687]KAF2132068.1 hypothetical protein P153DRAFT_429269 [Dothidotthia symphoricarpi CBS 119687]
MPALKVSHPGVTFYIFELQGTLQYTITHRGKPAREYELCEQDFDDNDAVLQDDSVAKVGPGTDASAVGVQLRVVKNDGVLSVVFERKDGGDANWAFNGMDDVTGGPRIASAATQTEVEASKCSTCGADRLREVDTSDGETQTEVKDMQDENTQTGKINMGDAMTQTSARHPEERVRIPRSRTMMGSNLSHSQVPEYKLR